MKITFCGVYIKKYILCAEKQANVFKKDREFVRAKN